MSNKITWSTVRKQRLEGIEVTLPSGLTARLRPVNLDDLIYAGQIPDALTSMVNKMLNQNIATTQDKPTADFADNPLETARDVLQYYAVICKSVFVYPRVVDDPQGDDEISFLDVLPEDREFVVTWAEEPQSRLSNFRSE